MLPVQYEIARTALSIGVPELAELAKDIVARLERAGKLRNCTIADVRRVLETGVVEFIRENGGDAGARLGKKAS